MAIFNQINGVDVFSWVFSLNLISTFVLGVSTSHLYRGFIIRYDWLKLRIAQLIPRVLLSSLVLATIFYVVQTFVSEVLISDGSYSIVMIDVLQHLINLSANYILWTLIYWSFHFIENYKKEEIKNLRWQATIQEMELNKIKSQLNPHFIFNSMNSIRALVGEQPEKAQDLITQLSNILRSSLYMERKPVLKFRNEMDLVTDYLSLEKARLEERLEIELDINEDCYDFDVPPLLVQTLVENAIKHGIAQLEKGGVVNISGRVMDGELQIKISNTGHLNYKSKKSKGIGLKISRQRLNLLYGPKAKLDLIEEDGRVTAFLVIPGTIEKIKEYESTNS